MQNSFNFKTKKNRSQLIRWTDPKVLGTGDTDPTVHTPWGRGPTPTLSEVRPHHPVVDTVLSLVTAQVTHGTDWLSTVRVWEWGPVVMAAHCRVHCQWQQKEDELDFYLHAHRFKNVKQGLLLSHIDIKSSTFRRLWKEVIFIPSIIIQDGLTSTRYIFSCPGQ